MIVVHIVSTETSSNGKRKWLLWEVEATGIEDLVKRFNAGEIVFGCGLEVRKERGSSAEREVVGASEIALTKGEIFRIEQPHFTLVRYEDEAADLTQA